MKTIIYIAGTLLTLLGFRDGPNFIPLVIGIVLLVLGWKFDTIFKSISTKNARSQLIELAELRDKGIINDEEYEERARILKTKI